MRRLWPIVVVAFLAGCGGGSPSPQTVTPTTPPTVTPAPTEVPPGGSGEITFGAKYDETTLLIPKPITRFKATFHPIAWSASFSEAAGATTVHLVLAKVASGGAETIITETDVSISNPTFDLLANSADLAGIADNKPGTYVLRYIRGSKVLAEGTFTLVK